MDRTEILKRLRPTITFVAPLLVLIALAAVLRFQQQSQPVVFEVDMPGTIEVPADTRLFPVEITLRLQNRSNRDIDLVAANMCEVLQWYVLDRTGSYVQAQFVDDCGDAPVAEIIRGKGTLVRTTSLVMDASRLEPGRRYDLMLKFWDYEGRARFRAAAPE